MNPRRHPLAPNGPRADPAEPPVPVERHLLVHVLPRSQARPRRLEACHLHRAARRQHGRSDRRGTPGRLLRGGLPDPEEPGSGPADDPHAGRGRAVRRRPGNPPRHRRRTPPAREYLATQPRQRDAATPDTHRPGGLSDTGDQKRAPALAILCLASLLGLSVNLDVWTMRSALCPSVRDLPGRCVGAPARSWGSWQ